jgi:hypothetical protein
MPGPGTSSIEAIAATAIRPLLTRERPFGSGIGLLISPRSVTVKSRREQELRPTGSVAILSRSGALCCAVYELKEAMHECMSWIAPPSAAASPTLLP